MPDFNGTKLEYIYYYIFKENTSFYFYIEFII